LFDRGPWYPYALKKIGLEYVHERFSRRSIAESLLEYLKQRTEKPYNNTDT